MIKILNFLASKEDRNPWEKGGLFRPDNWMENPYIGKDGSSYHSSEALNVANEEWKKSNIFYIGSDGGTYRSTTDMEVANRAWKSSMFSTDMRKVA